MNCCIYFLLPELLSAYGRVLSNPVYLVISLASCFHAVGIAGAMAFSPKYMSSQYSVPVWQANIILGKTVVRIWCIVSSEMFAST